MAVFLKPSVPLDADWGAFGPPWEALRGGGPLALSAHTLAGISRGRRLTPGGLGRQNTLAFSRPEMKVATKEPSDPRCT